jgi:DNA polymerase-3 subunit epsilon
LDSAARVLEVAVVVFEGGVIVREWSALINPSSFDWDNPKIAKALEVNKLTRDACAGKPTFEQILPDLLVELSHDVIAGHNLAFDLRLLGQELALLGRPPVVPRLAICTKNLAARMNSTSTGNRLADVACRYNVLQEGAHRAVVDAITCGRVLARMHEQGCLPSEDEAMRVLCSRAGSQWQNKHRW